MFLFETGSQAVQPAGIHLESLLFASGECWSYRCVPPGLDSSKLLKDQGQKSLRIRAASTWISAPQRKRIGGGAGSWEKPTSELRAPAVSTAARAAPLGPCGLRPLSLRRRRCTFALAAGPRRSTWNLGGGAGQLRGREGDSIPGWIRPAGRAGTGEKSSQNTPIPTPNLSKVSQFSKTFSKERKGKTFN